MSFSRRDHSRRSFTLLELIVVIVILGVLAALAVPTFQNVIDRSKDEAAMVTMTSVLREAAALAAFRGDTVMATEDLEAAIADLPSAAAVGVSAQTTWTLRTGANEYSDEFGVVHGAVEQNPDIAGVAGVTPTGRCAFARGSVTGVIDRWVSSEPIGEECHAQNAINGNVEFNGPGPINSGEIPVGAPGAPELFDVFADDGYFYLDWTTPADEGTSPVTSFEVSVTSASTDVDVTVPVAPDPGKIYEFYAGGTDASAGWFTDGTYDPYEFVDVDAFDAVVNGEAYTLEVRAVNDAGAGPALVETVTPAGVDPADIPDPPVILTQTSGYTGDPGEESAWIDITWDPPANVGSTPIESYEVRFNVPGCSCTVTVPADEPRHFRFQSDGDASDGGSFLSYGNTVDEEFLDGDLWSDLEVQLEVTATNARATSDPAYASVTTPTLPLWNVPALDGDYPYPWDLNGVTDGGWPAPARVVTIGMHSASTWFPGLSRTWAPYEIAPSGAQDVRITDVDWTFDGGDTWQSEGSVNVPSLNVPWHGEPLPFEFSEDGPNGTGYVFQAPYNLVSYDADLGGPVSACMGRPMSAWQITGTDYAPSWEPNAGDVTNAASTGKFLTSTQLSRVTDLGGNFMQVHFPDDPYPDRAYNADFRIRVRYTYDTLTGTDEASTVIVFHPYRAADNWASWSQVVAANPCQS